MRTAILVSGQRRDFDQKNFQKKILNVLPDTDVFFCMDDNSNLDVTNKSFSHDIDLVRTDVHPQFERMEKCYNFMKRNGVDYDFILRTRPDMVYFDNALPPQESWSKEAVQVRSRVVSEHGTPNCERSGWPADVRPFDLVDDQLFICPSALADKVFSTERGNASCPGDDRWPECDFQKMLNHDSVPTQRTCFNAVISKHVDQYFSS